MVMQLATSPCRDRDRATEQKDARIQFLERELQARAGLLDQKANQISDLTMKLSFVELQSSPNLIERINFLEAELDRAQQPCTPPKQITDTSHSPDSPDMRALTPVGCDASMIELRAQLENAKKVRRESLGELGEAKREITDVSNRLEQKEKMAKTWEEEASRLQQALTTTQTQLDQAVELHLSQQKAQREVSTQQELTITHLRKQLEEATTTTQNLKTELEGKCLKVQQETEEEKCKTNDLFEELKLLKAQPDPALLKEQHESEMKELTAQLETATEQLKDLEQQTQELEKQRLEVESKLNSTIEQLQTTIENMKKEMQEADCKVRTAQEQANATKEENEKLQNEFTVATENLSKEIQELTELKEQAEPKLREMEEQLETHSKAALLSDELHKKTQQEKDQLQQQLEKLTTAEKQHEKVLKTETDKVVDLQKALETVKSQLEDVKKSSGTTESEYNITICELENEIKSQQDKVNSMDKEVTVLLAKCSELETTLKLKDGALDKQKQDQITRNDCLQKALEELKLEQAEAKTSWERERTELVKEKNDAEKREQENKAHYDKHVKEIEESHKKSTKMLETAIQSLSARDEEMADKNKEIQTLQRQLTHYQQAPNNRTAEATAGGGGGLESPQQATAPLHPTTPRNTSTPTTSAAPTVHMTPPTAITTPPHHHIVGMVSPARGGGGGGGGSGSGGIRGSPLQDNSNGQHDNNNNIYKRNIGSTSPAQDEEMIERQNKRQKHGLSTTSSIYSLSTSAGGNSNNNNNNSGTNTNTGDFSAAGTTPKPSVPPILVSLSGFKDQIPCYTHKDKTDAIGHLSTLGGAVTNDQGTESFDRNVTHVISPPTARTVKTLAAAILGKWIVKIDWVTDSAKAGKFLSENSYGHKGDPNLFAHKYTFVSPKLKEKGREPTLKQLVEVYGRGFMTNDPAKADYVFVHNAEEAQKYTAFTAKVKTWEQFIDWVYPRPKPHT